jgi:hypothetical protein
MLDSRFDEMMAGMARPHPVAIAIERQTDGFTAIAKRHIAETGRSSGRSHIVAVVAAVAAVVAALAAVAMFVRDVLPAKKTPPANPGAVTGAEPAPRRHVHRLVGETAAALYLETCGREATREEIEALSIQIANLTGLRWYREAIRSRTKGMLIVINDPDINVIVPRDIGCRSR